MALLLLPAEQKAHDERSGVDENESSQNVFGRLSSAFTQAFERFRQSYVRSLSGALHRRFAALIVAVLVLASALAPLPFVGRDFFPTVDAGQFRLHVRAAPGTRIESTERLFEQVNDEIRRAIPPEELSGILDNIGLNLVNTFNLGLGDASTISTFDGEILVSLKPGHQPTANYVEILRERLPQRFPGAEFYFKPPDIVNQILNFGLAAPINVQVIGFDREGNYRIAKLIEERLKLVPGAVDVRLHQITAAPDLRINVDRTRAAELGLTQQEVANNLLVSLSSSAQVAPSYWVDPKLGIPYIVAVQTPQRAVNSIDALKKYAGRNSRGEQWQFASITKQSGDRRAAHRAGGRQPL
jgi:multidrug efflux pump subunit AcrB